MAAMLITSSQNWRSKNYQTVLAEICRVCLCLCLQGWGVSALVLHGRTARQRYTKLADWDYIKECSKQRRISVEEGPD